MTSLFFLSLSSSLVLLLASNYGFIDLKKRALQSYLSNRSINYTLGYLMA